MVILKIACNFANSLGILIPTQFTIFSISHCKCGILLYRFWGKSNHQNVKIFYRAAGDFKAIQYPTLRS